MQDAEDLQASTAAAADKDVAGANWVAPKQQLMEASLAAVLSQPQAVMPMALPQRLHLIRAEDPPFSMLSPANHQWGLAQYIPSAGGYGAGGHGNGRTPATPFSNRVKIYANWNVYYLCRFDVPDGHTSMMCPTNLHKLLHDVYFTQQNAQQYIALGHPCCIKNRHMIQMPGM
jgi:hypothetical protein